MCQCNMPLKCPHSKAQGIKAEMQLRLYGQNIDWKVANSSSKWWIVDRAERLPSFLRTLTDEEKIERAIARARETINTLCDTVVEEK